MNDNITISHIEKVEEFMERIDAFHESVLEETPSDLYVTENKNIDRFLTWTKNKKEAKELLKDAKSCIRAEEYGKAKKLLEKALDCCKDTEKIFEDTYKDNVGTFICGNLFALTLAWIESTINGLLAFTVVGIPFAIYRTSKSFTEELHGLMKNVDDMGSNISSMNTLSAKIRGGLNTLEKAIENTIKYVESLEKDDDSVTESADDDLQNIRNACDDFNDAADKFETAIFFKKKSDANAQLNKMKKIISEVETIKNGIKEEDYKISNGKQILSKLAGLTKRLHINPDPIYRSGDEVTYKNMVKEYNDFIVSMKKGVEKLQHEMENTFDVKESVSSVKLNIYESAAAGEISEEERDLLLSMI